jgi:hypothetical protein
MNDMIYDFLLPILEEIKECSHLSVDNKKQKELADNLRSIADILDEESEKDNKDRVKRQGAVDMDALRFRKRLGILMKDMDIWLEKHGMRTQK